MASDEAAVFVGPVDDDFVEAHTDLDGVERQLASIRTRQKLLLEPAQSEQKGSVELLDLRALIELDDDEDEEFDRRFGEFAMTDSGNDDRARRWMETH